MKMKLSFHLLIIVFTIPIISCNSQECRFCNEKQQGAVYENIRSATDSSIEYNLFVPSGTEDSLLPVIILFDPHGNTAPAIKKYIGLAEKYNVILAGFDASANEIPFEATWRKFKPWLSELYKTAPVDSTKLFVAGFSGGARVTSIIEENMPSVLATALCGAGPANIQTWMNHSQPVMLFAGTSDFNYLELNNLHNSPKINRKSSLSIFQGKHNWPPADAFEDFFVLIQRLSTGSVKSTNEAFFINRSQQFLLDGRPDIALYSASNALYAMGNLVSSKLGLFKDSLVKGIPLSLNVEMNLLSVKEIAFQKRIGILFQDGDTIKYYSFIDSLNTEIKKDSLSLQSDMLRRTMAYCGIAAYSFSNQAYKMKVPVFFRILRMYEYTEPDNIEMLTLFSTYYAGENECVKARTYLNRAKRKGFTDMKRLHKRAEFENCSDILD